MENNNLFISSSVEIFPMRMRFHEVSDLIDFLSHWDSYKEIVSNMIDSNRAPKGVVSFVLDFGNEDK